MAELRYKKIESIEQYNEYCDVHEKLFGEDEELYSDEIKLLEILIEDYERRSQVNKIKELNPVELIISLIRDSNISQSELAKSLGISKQLLSDILNFRRNISKSLVVKLANYFSMSQEAFSRRYPLKGRETSVVSVTLKRRVPSDLMVIKKGSVVIDEKSSPPSSKFEIFQGADKQYYFRLIAKNGEIIMKSEGYSNQAELRKDIDYMKDQGFLNKRLAEELKA